MAVPSTYTEKTLAEYMQAMLGKVAKALELTAVPGGAGDFQEAVNDALLAYGTNDISTISGMDNLLKLRALALKAAWQYVVNNFAALYDFSADGGTYSRSQLFSQAKQALEQAERQALMYDPAYQASVVRLDHMHDPYKYRPEEESSV
jgi:hypothetical protein